jgi:cytochrome c-type biogenesis protein CcmH/NrfF
MRAGRWLGGWTAGHCWSRRTLLGCLAAGVLAAYPPNRLSAQGLDSLPGSGPSGKLWDPARAGRPLAPVTARDNTDAIQAIEKQLRCTCGCGLDVYTCRTTDFSCTTSPEMHQRVLALAAQGKSGPEIIDAFVRENGVAILMAPPKHGFNLAGYFTPGILIVVAAVILIMVLRRWTRAATPAARTADIPAIPGSAEELERLNRELRQYTD